MTDYEYILAQCRKFHFTVWDDIMLRECHHAQSDEREETVVKVKEY